jgi:AcrR family transcriptional regulator
LTARKPKRADLARREPRQDRARKTIDRILEVSREILIAEGISGLTTREIAKAAGISVGVLYRYFPSKQAVLYQIFDDRLQQALSVFDEAIADLSLPLESVLERFYELQREFGVLNRLDLELRNAIDRDPRLAELTRHFEGRLSRRYVRVMKAYGSTMSDVELQALADYMHEIDHVNMKLQHDATKKQRKMHAATTMYIFRVLLERSGAVFGQAAVGGVS